MTELKRLIVGLIRGDQSFETVSRALQALVAGSPEAAADAARLLRAARKSGLPHHLFVALNGQLGSAIRAAGSPEATVFSAQDAGATRSRSANADTTAFSQGGSDVAAHPRSAAEPISPHVGRSRDSDATVVPAGDDDATRMGDPDDTKPPARGPQQGRAAGSRGAEITARPAVSGEETAMDAVAPDPQHDGGSGGNARDPVSAAGKAPRDPPGRNRPVPPSAPSRARAGVDREFTEGDLLRGRFELISKLGEGGMGAVWKGKDKLKEEARDRNPFVAIKLLQGDFKSHPEAFIALQRETAKQQRLAHPNIATVYDFDRDDATSTVFMTMEVLEGQPLDAFIRKLPADGLPEPDAMYIIEQLCNGLSYAHQASLVHSDLKPGNCFLTREGNIKLLDFGIARASKTKADAEGETTLFDPGKLGALTPTYATIEMFEGAAPDPRDDIYALAIMSYQLLTGRHPYGKRSAPKAQELGLVPEPVPGLTKRQNRGLARGLAFLREDRTPTVEEFLDSIQRRKSRTALWVGSGIAATVVVGLLSYAPIRSALEKSQREDIIARVQQPGPDGVHGALEQARALGGEQLALVLDDARVIDAAATFVASRDGANVEQGLALLAAFPPAWQGKVKDVEQARKAIFGHFERRILEAFKPMEQRYDYPAAVTELDQLDRLYPDSAQVFQLKSTLEDIKNETLADLGNRYKELLAAGKLVPVDNEADITDVLSVVSRIDAQHSLLRDKTLPFRFAQEADKAINQDGDYRRADALLAAGATYAPDDAKLKGLRYDLDRILARIESEKRIAELERRLAAAEPELKLLEDYQAVRDEIVALTALSAGSAILGRIQARLESAFDEEFSRLLAASRWQRGEELLFGFARLLSIEDLTRQRLALSQAQRQAGHSADLAARKPQVDERVAAVRALLDSPAFTIDWEARLKVPYKELIALQPLGSPELEKVRSDTARLMLGAAREARVRENFNQAREFVARGLEFYPGLANFTNELDAIASAEQAFAARRAQAERLAKIETLKSEFRERAQANDVQAALATAQAVRELGLDTQDPFLVDTVPQALAGAYGRLADTAAKSDNYLSAAELAREGLKLDPALESLARSLQGYETEVKKRERELRLAALFDSLQPIDAGKVQQAIAALQTEAPERFDAVVAKLSAARASQLRRYARGQDVDLAVLAARAGEFTALFPAAGAALVAELAAAVEPRLRRAGVDSAEQLAALARPLAAFRDLAPQRHAQVYQELASRALGTIRAAERTDKAAAAALLRAAKSAFPGDRELAALSILVPLQEIATGLAQLQRGELAAAARSLAAAKAKDATHPEVSPFESQLGARRARSDALYAQHVAKARDPLGYKLKDEIRDLFRQAQGLCSDCDYTELQPARPVAGLCHAGLAGFGNQRAGECWDQIGRDKGPIMVVVPAGGGNGQPFAIGKYEMSQRDFNVFCKETGSCKVVPGSRSRLPATEISVQQAEAYAAWLSRHASEALQAKVVYRLPTEAEWEHAANANGAQPEKKFNCTVTSGGNKIAGFDLLDARSGHANGWGLANYVGNAQELVTRGGVLAVRGGDYDTPLTRCEVSVSQPHSGAPDATTGFRLVRELG